MDNQLGTCKSLDTEKPLHDRQMAFYAFEGIANIAHFYEAVSVSTTEVLDYHRGRANEFVNDFTSASRLQRAVLEREKARDIAMAGMSALLLMSTSAASFGTTLLGTDAKLWHEIASEVQGLITSIYISYVGLARSIGANGVPDVRNNK
jgi:hypothetical protein